MFNVRSDQRELLDGDVTASDLFLNLKELHFINKKLGGYRVSLDALKKINFDSSSHLVDVGFGGGETLSEIQSFFNKSKIKIQLSGIDLKIECKQYAAQHLPKNIQLITDDYRNLDQHLDRVTHLHAALFCHHLTNSEIIELIEFCIERNITLIINDLQRHPIAYYSIKVLTQLFSKSHLVKNDAPLSVLRGFTKKEWLALLKHANSRNFQIKNKWAFRHQLIIYPNNEKI
jgi:hypothetical protein